MQFIESTNVGIKSAYSKWTGRADEPIIHLFPMVHIGDKEFYETVLEKLSHCDIILAEGVDSQNSKQIKVYTQVARNPKLGLVVQKRLTQDDLPGDVIQADVSGSDFDKKMAQLPFLVKLKLRLILPFAGILLRYFSTRQSICEEIGSVVATEIAIPHDELQKKETAWGKAKDVMLDWRDAQLINKLNEEIEKAASHKTNIAIVYGAAHMKAVEKHLIEVKRYSLKSSEWLSVIKL